MRSDTEVVQTLWTESPPANTFSVLVRPLRCGEDDDFDEDDESFVEEHGVSSEDDFDEDDFDDEFDDDFEEEIEEEDLVASDDDTVATSDDDADIEFEDDDE